MQSAGMLSASQQHFIQKKELDLKTNKMSKASNYQNLLPEIQAIPDNEIIQPGMAVDICKQEAENLYDWAVIDIDKLMARGLNGNIIMVILLGTDSCSSRN